MGDRVRAEVELEQLTQQIRYHEAAYRAGAPEITDAAFDDLVDRYQELADQLLARGRSIGGGISTGSIG